MSNYVPINEYYPFSPETVNHIESWREEVNGSYDSYGQYFEAVGGEIKTIHSHNRAQYIQVLDIRPDEHDPQEALVVHLPMANPLDPNMRFQVAAIADACKDKRVISLANPSGPGRKYDTLSKDERSRLVGGDNSVLALGYAAYIESERIAHTKEYGYSYGVDKVLGSVAIAAADVRRAFLLEPASVERRSVLSLAKAFGDTEKALQEYVEAGDMPIFEEARDDSIGLAAYSIGLARLTNLAIAKTIAKGNFTQQLNGALRNKSELEVTVGWGTETELSDSSALYSIIKDARKKHGDNRVKAVSLLGQKHAIANNVPLQAALVYELLVNKN